MSIEAGGYSNENWSSYSSSELASAKICFYLDTYIFNETLDGVVFYGVPLRLLKTLSESCILSALRSLMIFESLSGSFLGDE